MRAIYLRGILAFVIVAIGVFGWWTWHHHLANGTPTFSGYVDADYVFVSSAVGGTLKELDVHRGEKVKQGTLLFLLDDVAERGARDEADAQLQQVEAQLADLLTGRRPPEIEAIAAQLAQAQAALKQSQAEYQRQSRLQPAGASSIQQLELARAKRDQDEGHVKELDAQLRVARLPGRDEQINAAQAAVAAAQATLTQAQWRLDQKTGLAPVAAEVIDTLYRPGEMIAAGMPAVQLLPPENIKIRFFVPETIVAKLSVGQVIHIACDGCGNPIASVVRFIAPQAEFTPPVIYSREQRSRLVYMVEARPTERIEALRVGQPVDVTTSLP